MTLNIRLHPRLKLDATLYKELHRSILERDEWRCQYCGSMSNLQVHHIQSRARLGDDTERNLITLCDSCHRHLHLRLME
jgi:5-methylcytosine-specific restriction endonuclease McrA